MGGSVIQDVSAKLVDQFARNLGEMLAGAPAEAAASNGGAETGDGRPQTAEDGRRQTAESEAPDQEGVDALGVAASVAADRMKDPRVLFGTLAIVLLIGWLLGRRSG